MALVQRDFILRMIEAIAAAVARAFGKRQTGDHTGARLELHQAAVALLGPAATLAMQVDVRTAADVVGDARRIALWARLLHEDAEILRLMERSADAEATDRRALALLLASQGREPDMDDDSRSLLEALRLQYP